MFCRISAANNDSTPPNLYPVHQPTTAIAAPAAMDFPSFSPICSILKASTVISWVDDAIAIIKPTETTKAKFSDGSSKLQRASESKMIICIKTIHPLLWPIFFVKYGICILSIKGAHK